MVKAKKEELEVAEIKEKTVNLDEALKNRATGASGYRAYYHQLIKNKNRE